MAKKQEETNGKVPGKRRRPPKLDPDGREKQLMGLAMDLAEEQLRDGTASSTVLYHFLKMASSRERLERENLKSKTQLVKAQAEAALSAKKQEALYEEAIKAFRRYSGEPEDE